MFEARIRWYNTGVGGVDMNKREELHFSISADDAFVDSLSGMMMNRRRLLQGKRRIKKCTTTCHTLLIQGVVLFSVGIFWLLQRGNGPQAVAHLILMSVSFLLGLLWIFMGISNLFRFYQRRRRYHSGAEEASLIADQEGLTLCYESWRHHERWNDLQLCALAPDVIAILYASAGMILLPHTDVLEAAVRKLLDKYTDACVMETIVMY